MLRYDERTIEVQLRTDRMHDWSISVEKLGGRLGLDIKSGKAPPGILGFFQLVSKIDDLLERGQVVPDDLRTAVTTARATAIALIEELEEQR